MPRQQGFEAHIFMPKDVPFANYVEAVAYGAKVTLVDGLISDCARIVNERKQQEGWFDISTLKEPFRIEGKKTMGYELVEQLGWEYPDAVFYPTGGGVGLIGMWKAFEEMEELGWVKPGNRPRMIAVQAAGCAPVVRAYDEGDTVSQNVAECIHLCCWAARSQTLRRCHHSRYSAGLGRHCTHPDRRRNPGFDPGLGPERRDISIA
jgi:threonine synthase